MVRNIFLPLQMESGGRAEIFLSSFIYKEYSLLRITLNRLKLVLLANAEAIRGHRVIDISGISAPHSLEMLRKFSVIRRKKLISIGLTPNKFRFSAHFYCNTVNIFRPTS